MKRTAPFAAALAGAALWAAACAAQDAPIPGDAVVARIGAEDIMLSEIIGAVYALPEEARAGRAFEEIYDRTLQERIDRSLAARAAIAEGLRETPAVARALAEAERGILADAWMRGRIAARVSEDAARERYGAILADAAGKTELRVRHIRAADRAQARALHERILAGEDFEEVARGLDFPGADKGGDLGYFSEGAMAPAIVQAARALAVGQVSEPFPTQYGWHLIRLEAVRPMPVPPFGELRESILRALTEEAVAAALARLRAAIPVERFDRDGSPLDGAR